MKVLIAGDTHGVTGHVKTKIDLAQQYGIQRIVIVGDFGLWWGHRGVVFLDDINRMAQDANIQIFAIPGNHECHELWDAMITGARAAQQMSRGWAYVRSNVLLAPKVHDFVWGGKQFVVAGGAVSIDKKWRMEDFLRSGKKSWSAGETLTDDDIIHFGYSRFNHGTKVDYLLTHDCSDYTPFAHNLVPDPDSKNHRQKIDKIIGMISPAMHFHGHMHHKYEWSNTLGTGMFGSEPVVNVATYGLGCNNENASAGILDTADDSFVWVN